MESIQLREEFDSPIGAFENYDTYDSRDLSLYKHIDVRTFYTAWAASSGTVTQYARSQYSNRMTLEVAGTPTIDVQSLDIANPLDLVTGMPDDAMLSIALPDFPKATVTLGTSRVELTTGPTFAAATTAGFNLSESTLAISSQGTHVEARFPYRDLGIDLTKVTGIRLLFKTIGATTVRVLAIRILPPDWVFLNQEIDTRRGVLRRGIARTGDPSAPPATQLPLLVRSASPPGEDDPRPADGEFALTFNSGTLASANLAAMYFRELSEDFLTQLDLNSLTMADLNGRPQPDTGLAMFNSRTQSDLAMHTNQELQGESQFSLERKADFLSSSYIQFILEWGTASSKVTIVDSEDNSYPISFGALTANKNYVFYATLIENTARATIYEITAQGRVGTKVFDSGEITDDFTFKRRRGRFGWFSTLDDGAAYIDSIRDRGVTYAEYRSLPFESNTPVVGAELFASFSPPLENYVTLAPGPSNTASSIVRKDTERSTTGESWRIDVVGTDTDQGFQTNLFWLSDFDNSKIAFDLFYPGAAIAAGVRPEVYLLDEVGNRFDLLLPRLVPDQWQKIRIEIPFGQTALAENYRFVITTPTAFASTWWVDNMTIFSRSVVWDARNDTGTPWDPDDSWIPFYDNLNRESGGVQFPDRGKKLQVRARALRQDSTISRIQFKPRYAELGRFIEHPEIDRSATATSPVITPTTLSTFRRRFTTANLGSGGVNTVLYEWYFGDGNMALGQTVEHTYVQSGSYTVTLVTTNNYGIKSLATASVAVTS